MRKRNIGLTKLEKKNPLGLIANGLSDAQIVEELKSIDFLTDNLKLTRRGKEYITEKLQNMDNVERIMLERFVLEHHNIELDLEYNN